MNTTNTNNTTMQQNLTDETKRRLALCLAASPHHANRRRLRFQERTVAVLLAAGLLGWLALLAAHVTAG